ncbi:MAG TPA: hypothetical protein VMS38_33930 [Pseudorhodoferax sp.]|jgi:hypothetical protein|nr:hypothetical protein [Pseudorhodoferax sp.]
MRKAVSLAVCAAALATAGPLAAIESAALAPLSDPLSARIAQAMQMLRGAPEPAAKAPLVSVEPGRGGTRAQAAPAESSEDGAGSYVVMLAGLIIMGAIVRRR